ncbi:hypothetical protein ACH5RR_019123 [Cinchona calisaya]|uniref:F-box domain-containing protein n=1 Tax=Cinchona calisaya TaxID=153742 RepID=A0ABD2ZNS2_9GENT
MFIEILLRLPVKSLIRLKCVCKSWCTLFQSPRFVAIHLRHAKNNERHFIKCMKSSLLSIWLPPVVDGEPSTQLSIHSDIESGQQSAASDASVTIPNLLQQLPFAYNGYNVRFVGHCNGLVCLIEANDIYLLCKSESFPLRRLHSQKEKNKASLML